MLHQHEPLTQYISCPVCCKVFNDSQQRPISLACGHTVCRSCLLGRLGTGRCPFDQKPFPENAETLPANFALMQLVEATSIQKASDDAPIDSDYPECYSIARQCIQEISIYLKPLAENSSDDEGSSSVPPSSPQVTEKSSTKCLLSRPLQRKVISLIQCQLLEEEGRSRATRIARSIGERVVSELLSLQQFPHQLSANLWAAVRARGCQFLGPAMQEEALKLILLTLENGCMLSRKVLVLYVVGKLSSTYPHASKTAIGHVVQLLYRASCFRVAKRDEESSLMQLKEEFREYEALRREHDAQIVQIAMEAGIRIPPEQWSSLLYGDLAHKSHMQSIMDKLQNPQSFSQCVLELVQVLQRNGDPGGFLKLRHRFEFLSCVDPSTDAQVPSLQDMKAIMQSLNMVMKAFISFVSLPSPRVHSDSQAVPNARYKTSMCRDVAVKGVCPRGNSCTFAHSQEELDRHRLRSRRSMNKQGLKPEEGSFEMENNVGGQGTSPQLDLDEESCLSGDDLHSVSFESSHIAGSVDSSSCDNIPPNSFELPAAADSVSGYVDNDVTNPSSSMPPHPPPSFPPATLLTFSHPAEEASGVPFCPRMGLQTSFHPHNMRAPPPFIPPMAPSGHTYAPPHPPSHSGHQINLRFQGHHRPPPPPPSHVLAYGQPHQVTSHSPGSNSLGNTRGSSEPLVGEFNPRVTSECRGCGLATTPHDAIANYEQSRISTQSFGPDGALQTLLHSQQENSLEDLRSRKKEIINNLQGQPTFLNTRVSVYSADSVRGGFDGLKTVLGNNQRNKEAMPKLVSDMFVATRSTQSLDMLDSSDYLSSEYKELLQSTSITECSPQHGCPNLGQNRTTLCTNGVIPVTEHSSPLHPQCKSPTKLYNTLGTSFDMYSVACSHYQDTEFSCFPQDDDDEIFIPYDQTVVSRFGPISRMARAKTHNCAPVQVTADSCKKMTPVLAATPLERPLPITVSVNSRFGSFGEQYPEPGVKPTATEVPSIWQESPRPSQMNIALLRAGAAEAVSNNERLAYELQALELEISLKTGTNPEPVQKLIHEAVTNCPPLPYPFTSTSTLSVSGMGGHRLSAYPAGMGHGHVTDCLASLELGSNLVSSEMAAKDVMEEYQRSWKGVTT